MTIGHSICHQLYLFLDTTMKFTPVYCHLTYSFLLIGDTELLFRRTNETPDWNDLYRQSKRAILMNLAVPPHSLNWLVKLVQSFVRDWLGKAICSYERVDRGTTTILHHVYDYSVSSFQQERVCVRQSALHCIAQTNLQIHE